MGTIVVTRALSRQAARPKVLVVGMGGLGAAVAELLAETGACELLLSDGDVVDASNLPRQWLYDESDIGQKKAEVAAKKLGGKSMPAWSSAQALADLVIDGCDDAELKFTLADTCVRAGVPLVTGGVIGSSGFVHTWVSRETPCLRCIFEGPNDEMRRACRDAGVLSTLPPLVGSVMAAAALRILSEGAPSSLWSIDLQRGEARSSDWPKRHDCAVCA